MARPRGTTGSLGPTFVSARPVGLAVRRACALTRNGWFPTSLSPPSRASVTLWEATAPVKLPAMQGPGPGSRAAVRQQARQGWYFKAASTPSWRLGFIGSHLSYTWPACCQCKAVVKVHGVFPSDRGYARIFTGSSISLSRCWRQRGSRYAIRAGRNLPDKEFRYLRTVIVTAAVYRGFGSKLAPLPLTFRHRAGVRPYTSSCDFAEPCVFSKQSSPPGLCHLPLVAQEQVPLLPKLRGQVAEFLQHRSLKRLGMLNQSTCVGFGYGP